MMVINLVINQRTLSKSVDSYTDYYLLYHRTFETFIVPSYIWDVVYCTIIHSELQSHRATDWCTSHLYFLHQYFGYNNAPTP